MVESSIKAALVLTPPPPRAHGEGCGGAVPSLGTLRSQHLRLGRVCRCQTRSDPEPAAINKKFPNELIMLQRTAMVQ